MIRPFVILASLAAALPAGAATTIQQDFDAAQALLDAGKAAEARDAFTALLARFPAGAKGKASSLVRARLGSTLIATGDLDAAALMLEAALPGLAGTTPLDSEERAVTRFDLGRAQEARGAIDSAAASYRSVRAEAVFAADSGVDIALRAALARTLIWSDPGEARRLLDALLALPDASLGKAPAEQRALLQTLRGRVELNNGNPGEARRWFTMAARSAGGGETSQVTVADVRIRGDLALAYQRLGLTPEAQKYVALSGAGSLVDEGLTSAAAQPLPGCAPVTGLATDAVAVVEFSIGADGRAVGVTPIFVSRGSGPATAERDAGPEALFTEAVRRWFWNTATVAKLNSFWRQSVRVELRCFTARPGTDPVNDAFSDEESEWFAAQGIRPLPDLPDNDAAALPILRTELARREQVDGAQSPQLIRLLAALASNDAAPIDERRTAVARWAALLHATTVPFAVRTDFRLTEILWQSVPIPTRAATQRFKREQQAKLLAEVEGAGQGASRVAMLVRLRLGETMAEGRDRAGARAQFEAIAAAPTTVLAAADPIRTTALLRLSNIAAAERDTAAAASAFAATGLTAEQCSLVDVKPEAAINNRVSDSIFPSETRRWGTGGFARIGFDITVDGKPTNVRTIVASPPFVFGVPTERAIGQFRYRPVYRPGNTIGCTGSDLTIRFRVTW